MTSYFDRYAKVAQTPEEEEWILFTYRKVWEQFPGHRILDIGCGPGYFGRAAPSGRSAFGVDIDLAAVRFSGPRCCLGSADSLPFPDATFAGVHCAHLIEHVPSPERVVREIYRVLRPGGTLMLITPDIKRYRFEFYHDHTHRTPFTDRGLVRLLQIHDFDVMAVERGLIHPTRAEMFLRRFLKPSNETVYQFRKTLGLRWNWELVCLAVKREQMQ